MSLFEEAMAVAVQMPTEERERLARALVSRPASSDPAQSAAWRQAETGHAVLDTASAAREAEADIAGPRALAALWGRPNEDPVESETSGSGVLLASGLPANSPVVVHTDVCAELGYGNERALQFFESPGVEIRLATATYLALLGAAEDADQLRRVQRFVSPYAVLSLGPMASSRAVELMIGSALEDGLAPLDALVAARAWAH